MKKLWHEILWVSVVGGSIFLLCVIVSLLVKRVEKLEKEIKYIKQLTPINFKIDRRKL